MPQPARLPRTLCFAALLLVLLPGAYAEERTADDPQARWYDVELVVFARTAASAGASEHWPGDPGAPDLSRAQPLSRLMLDPDLPLAENAFRTLPAEQRQLGGVYRAILNGAGMEPLMYAAWRQPVTEQDQSTPVYLTTAAGPGERAALEGTITVSAKRYLHIDTDLVLRDRDGSSYRMQAHRRMRSGELHYLDHPLMGIVVEARPVDSSAAPDTDPGVAGVSPGESATDEEAAPAAGGAAAEPSR